MYIMRYYIDIKYCTKLERIFKGYGKYFRYTINRKIRLKPECTNEHICKNTYTHTETERQREIMKDRQVEIKTEKKVQKVIYPYAKISNLHDIFVTFLFLEYNPSLL